MSVRAWDEAATTTAEAHRLASDTQRTQDQAVARSILAGSELMRGDYRDGTGSCPDRSGDVG